MERSSASTVSPCSTLHVAHVITSFAANGPGMVLAYLFPHLRKSGVKLTAIALDDLPGPSVDQRLREAGAETATLGMHGWLDVMITERLAETFKQHQPDLVHTHLLRADLFGRSVALQSGIPFVTTVHSTDPYRSKWYLWPLNRLERRTLKRCKRVICISKAVQEYTCRTTGLDPNLCKIIPSGIDPEENQNVSATQPEQKDRPFTVGAIGDLTRQKGHRILVEAVRYLKDDSRCLIAGQGPLRRKLGKLAGSLDIGNRVKFLGWVDDIKAFLAGLDVFVAPSLIEGQSLAVLEAMAAGLPVVASRVGGLPEVVQDGVTGLLAAPGNPLELQEAIKVLRDDPSRRRDMGQAGRERVQEHFTSARMAEGYLQVYEKVLKG